MNNDKMQILLPRNDVSLKILMYYSFQKKVEYLVQFTNSRLFSFRLLERWGKKNCFFNDRQHKNKISIG